MCLAGLCTIREFQTSRCILRPAAAAVMPWCRTCRRPVQTSPPPLCPGCQLHQCGRLHSGAAPAAVGSSHPRVWLGGASQAGQPHAHAVLALAVVHPPNLAVGQAGQAAIGALHFGCKDGAVPRAMHLHQGVEAGAHCAQEGGLEVCRPGAGSWAALARSPQLAAPRRCRRSPSGGRPPPPPRYQSAGCTLYPTLRHATAAPGGSQRGCSAHQPCTSDVGWSGGGVGGRGWQRRWPAQPGLQAAQRGSHLTRGVDRSAVVNSRQAGNGLHVPLPAGSAD